MSSTKLCKQISFRKFKCENRFPQSFLRSKIISEYINMVDEKEAMAIIYVLNEKRHHKKKYCWLKGTEPRY